MALKHISLFILALVFILNFATTDALPEPSISIYPNSLSVNSSFVMVVDPMTTKAPIRIAWAVFNPNMDGNYLMGQVPIVNGKGICYFSNQDEEATCGPSPFIGEGEMLMEVFVTASDNGNLEYGNASKVTRVGSIKMSGGPAYSEDDNLVYLTYYMTQDQADSVIYSVYNDKMQAVQGLTHRSTIFKMTPTPGFYANLSLEPGEYFISSIATKNGGEEFGGRMDKVVVPKRDVLTIGPCKNLFFFGEEISFNGATTKDEVEIKLLYPNGSVADSKTKSVINGEFSYSFSPPVSWPEGVYNITLTSDDLETHKQIALKRLVKASPSEIDTDKNKGDSISEKIGLENTGTEDINITISTTGNLKEDYLQVASYKILTGKSTIVDIKIDNINETVSGDIIVKSGDAVTHIPISINVEDSSGGGDNNSPECPQCDECTPSAGSAPFTLSPLIWSRSYMAGEKATITINIKNTGNTTLDGFSYKFINDASSSDYSDLPYPETSPSIDSLTIDPDKSETIDLSFTTEDAGSYKGRIEISTRGGSSYILINAEVYENISSKIDEERTNIGYLENEIDPDLYSELESYLDGAESDLYMENYEGAESEIEKTAAIREIIENYGSVFTGGSGGSGTTTSSTGSGGSGTQTQPKDLENDGMTTIIIIIVILIAALGGVGVYIYMKNKKEGSGSEDEISDEDLFDKDLSDF